MNIQEFSKSAQHLESLGWKVSFEGEDVYIQAPEGTRVHNELRTAAENAGGNYSEGIQAVRIPVANLPELTPEQEKSLYNALSCA